MGVNFGYGGYGMNMMGMMPMAHNNGENTFRKMKEEYGCEHCYNYGPMPYNYQMQVNALPSAVTHPTIWSRIVRKFTGA